MADEHQMRVLQDALDALALYTGGDAPWRDTRQAVEAALVAADFSNTDLARGLSARLWDVEVNEDMKTEGFGTGDMIGLLQAELLTIRGEEADNRV